MEQQEYLQHRLIANAHSIDGVRVWSSGSSGGVSGGESSEERLEVLRQEEAILRHFSKHIQAACGESVMGDLPVIAHKWWRVSASAIVYFRRFYLHNNLLSHDPRVILLGCIILAGKVEESRVYMRDLHLIHDKCTEEEVVAAEARVLEGISFMLKVNHPQNISQTMVADYKRLVATKSAFVAAAAASSSSSSSIAGAGAAAIVAISPEASKEWLDNSDKKLLMLQLSNACLCHTSLAIAVCALQTSEPRGLPFSFHEYLIERLGEAAALQTINEASKVALLLPSAMACAETKSEIGLSEYMPRLREQACWGKKKSRANKKQKTETTVSTTDGGGRGGEEGGNMEEG